MTETEKNKVKKEKAEPVSMSEFLNPKRERRTLTPFEKYVKTLCYVGKKK